MKSFYEIFKKKNKWTSVNSEQKKKLAHEFFELVKIAYYPIGGYLKIKNENDILSEDWNIWKAIDIDTDPQSDVVIFGKKTKYGVKLSGSGHDGNRESKRAVLDETANLLNNDSFIEVSKKKYEILINKYKINIINDQQIVRKILRKKIEWFGNHPNGLKGDPYNKDGWYGREIGGKNEIKILMGNPKI